MLRLPRRMYADRGEDGEEKLRELSEALTADNHIRHTAPMGRAERPLFLTEDEDGPMVAVRTILEESQPRRLGCSAQRLPAYARHSMLNRVCPHGRYLLL